MSCHLGCLGRCPLPILAPGTPLRSYTKFLVDRDGVPRKRFKPGFDPLEFEADVRLLLAGRAPLPAECATKPGRKVCTGPLKELEG